MANNMLINEKLSKFERLKTILDLIVLEVCATSLALFIDCIAFYSYFNNTTTPVVLMALLIAISIGSYVFRNKYLAHVWDKSGLGSSMVQSFGLGAKASRTITNVFVYIILIAITCIWLFPFLGIVLESFRVESTGQESYFIPKQFGLDNYIELYTKTDFLKWFFNTALLGVATAFLQTIFVLSMSYTLSRLRFKGRKGLMNFMLILGMFPGFLTLILIYKVFYDMGLTEANAPYGLILVYCASSAMGYYVSKGFFDTIPKTLDEAARVDGATRWQVFYKVILPLSKPIIIYTILMGFMAPWGDFMMANYLAHQVPEGKNVAVGMFQWLERSYRNQRYTMFCAGGVTVALPVTTVFLCLQKYYVEGVTGGAVKG